MKRVALVSIRFSFILLVISSLLSLAMYSSLISPKNSISRIAAGFTIDLTEEEEERTVREVPEVAFYIDYVATAQLNFKNSITNFPLYLNLSPQDYSANFKKPPRFI